MGLTGRIDRIDYNEELGEYFIIDYKSSEIAYNPEKTHRNKDCSWIDLQLPAYHYAMRAGGIDKPIRLGYACLPADGEKSGIYMAEWSAEDIEHSIRFMCDIALKIYNQQFWPPSLEISDAWQARYQFGLSNLGS